MVLQDDLCEPQHQPQHSGGLGVQLGHGGVGEMQGVLAGWQRNHLRAPLLPALDAVVDEGEREDVDVDGGN